MRKTNLDWKTLVGRISPYNLKKAALYLRHFGVKGFWAKLTDRFEKQDLPYPKWRLSHIATEQELARQRKSPEGEGPLFSIISPLYQTQEEYLRQMIESVCAQTYGKWELCLADASPAKDGAESKAVGEKTPEAKTQTALTGIVREYAARDPRIHYRILSSNEGISENMNAGARMASGGFLCFLDHDDFLEPDTLYELAKALKEQPKADLLYTDEDKVSADGTEFFQPHFKPDFNPFLLRSNNYICHFLTVRAQLFEETGGFRKEFDGAQDYDLILRCTEKASGILHIPKALYHWRTHTSSTAENPFSKDYAYEAGKRAIEEHLKRCRISGEVVRLKYPGFYRVRYAYAGAPKVSVIIPNKDQGKLLTACVESVWEKTAYKNYEIIIVENNSESSDTAQYYRRLREKAGKLGKTLRIIKWKGAGFNYPKLNNCGAKAADGEYLLFLNNDITVRKPGFLEELLGVCSLPEVGAAGARLYYPDGTIQHAGIIIGIGGVAGSLFVNMSGDRGGYMNRAALLQNLSAVTAACMLVKKSVYEQLGGMEERLAVSFNDVDFCLRLNEAGYQVVYDPYAQLYHHESKTRGAEDTPEKIRRFQNEIEFMRSRWIKILRGGDPYYNPNFSLKTWNYELKH